MTHLATSQPDGFAEDSLTEQMIDELAAVLDLERAEILPGCQLRQDFGCQPRDFDNLRCAIQGRFGFAVPVHAVPGWKDVGDLIAYVELRMKGESARA